MEHGFDLGQKLKLHYDHSIDLSHNGSSVKVFSTNYDRTLDTVTSLLLGMYSRQRTATNVQRVCHCREAHGTQSSPTCIAECIGINSADLPDIPEITVVAESDPILHQSKVCKGWDAWIEHLESSSSWTTAADTNFVSVKARIASLVGSETVEALQWPDGACKGCANINDKDSLGLMEQVLAHTRMWLVN